MKPFEEQFTAWIDGKLTGRELTEFEDELREHPEAAAERDGARALGNLLRSQAAPPLRNPDFFNHQLMQRIAAETPRPVEKKRSFFWSIPGLAWTGACSLIVAAVLFKTTIPAGPPSPKAKTGYFAQVVEIWSKSPNVTASTVYSPEDDATVIWLDGLDYIPANYEAQR
jgi:anti-sigma factor RsiW